MTIEITADFHPLVYTKVSGSLEVEDIRVMAARFEAIFARGARFTNLTDTRSVKTIPSASVRREVAAYLRETESSMGRYCRGSSTLIESQLLRGALTAIYWIITPPVPQHLPTTSEEGLDWCVARLLEAGGDPTALAARRAQLMRHITERARLAS